MGFPGEGRTERSFTTSFVASSGTLALSVTACSCCASVVLLLHFCSCKACGICLFVFNQNDGSKCIAMKLHSTFAAAEKLCMQR